MLNENILQLIGRKYDLFATDILAHENELIDIIASSKFLILGGAGSIGSAVVKEIFQRNPLKLHVVDVAENNLAELVRDIRSSQGYISGEFRTFCIDISSSIFDSFFGNEAPYDYVLNFSALKHVRSEKDPYTLMRMIEVNILNTMKTLELAIKYGSKKYFCVSTDKAANPVNLMGATKRIMEHCLLQNSSRISISTARFANVAFSEGSLLDSFLNRMQKNQPLAAPFDIKRYFITPSESGVLCLMSCLLGENMDIFFPKLEPQRDLIDISDIAFRFIRSRGFEVHLCDEAIAKSDFEGFKLAGKWPCVLTSSDTTGEKPFEEFFTEEEVVDWNTFMDIAIIKNRYQGTTINMLAFKKNIQNLINKGHWTKEELVIIIQDLLPGFVHDEFGKSLDDKM